MDRRQLCGPVLIALAGGCASILMFWITANGPGVQPDSVTYMETARSLLAGRGFSAGGQPMTHYAPGYPLLLAMFSVLCHGSVLEAGRLLCALFFGANLALVGIAVFTCTDRSWWAAGCAMCIFLASAPVLSTHAWVQSEAPSITFVLCAFVLLSLHVVHPSPRLLLAASLSAGCAMATRYVGVTLLPPIVVGLLCFGDRPLKRRIEESVFAAVVASLPLTAWFVRNIVTTGTSAHRALAVHLFDADNAKELIRTMHYFVLPIFVSLWIRVLHLAVAAVLVVLSLAFLNRKNHTRRNADDIRTVLPALCILFFLSYVVFLVISVSFVDAHTALDDRILLPAFVAAIVAIVSLVWSLACTLHSRILWYGFVLFVFLSVTINSDRAVAAAVDLHRNGGGYTAQEWQGSQTIAAVKSLPGGVRIYSNGPDVIQFLAGRAASTLPVTTNANSLEPNRAYPLQLEAVCKELGEGKAIVVYLSGVTWRWYLPTQNQLESQCDMPILARLEDGTIYGQLTGRAQEDDAVPRKPQSDSGCEVRVQQLSGERKGIGSFPECKVPLSVQESSMHALVLAEPSAVWHREQARRKRCWQSSRSS